ncbi:MAG: ATP-binding cassette domain-containing protein, partial [Thermofilum sp.]|uniref:ATP-binding cassette domain-containing protein n=1 Tax=Thermofilum sp. TaxID=1961369 RepID=UPI003167F568
IVRRLVPDYLMERDPFTLSGGEAKRVSIASVLIADQPVWLLDEPFDNMDLQGVLSLAQLINEGVRRGKNIIVSLNNPTYASLLDVDDVMLIDSAVSRLLVFEPDSLDGLIEKYGVLSRRRLCSC